MLVTGGTGFLGGWLVRRLLENGAAVTCIVRDWVPNSELLRTDLLAKVNVVRGDVTDRDLLERVLGEYEVETVFHLAAQTIVGIANRNPISTFESNIGGTWSTLEACRRSPRVNGIVLASSDKAYGDQDNSALHGRHSSARMPSLRCQQILRRSDRQQLRHYLQASGRHHALRQSLRRRRFELESSSAGYDPLRRSRAAAR